MVFYLMLPVNSNVFVLSKKREESLFHPFYLPISPLSKWCKILAWHLCGALGHKLHLHVTVE